jgi:NADH:ubiquinone oxidoreductase subunit
MLRSWYGHISGRFYRIHYWYWLALTARIAWGLHPSGGTFILSYHSVNKGKYIQQWRKRFWSHRDPVTGTSSAYRPRHSLCTNDIWTTNWTLHLPKCHIILLRRLRSISMIYYTALHTIVEVEPARVAFKLFFHDGWDQHHRSHNQKFSLITVIHVLDSLLSRHSSNLHYQFFILESQKETPGDRRPTLIPIRTNLKEFLQIASSSQCKIWTFRHGEFSDHWWHVHVVLIPRYLNSEYLVSVSGRRVNSY